MLKLKVSYFLNQQGLNLFQSWYNKVACATSVQDGFLNMILEEHYSENKAIVFLFFENQNKLDKWIETKAHDELVAEIEPYLIKTEVVDLSNLVAAVTDSHHIMIGVDKEK
jgi:hypothetical protein